MTGAGQARLVLLLSVPALDGRTQGKQRSGGGASATAGLGGGDGEARRRRQGLPAELGATAATGSRRRESDPERSRRRKALERRCPWRRSSMGGGDVQFLQGGEDDADVLDGHDGRGT